MKVSEIWSGSKIRAGGGCGVKTPGLKEPLRGELTAAATFILEDFAISKHEQMSENGIFVLAESYWPWREFGGNLGSSIQGMCQYGFLQGRNLKI